MRIAKIIIFIAIAPLLVGCLIKVGTEDNYPTPSHYTKTLNNELSLIWYKEEVKVAWNGFSPMVGAAEGFFCFPGKLTNENDVNIICLNSKTGEPLLSYKSDVPLAFSMDSSGLYLGYFRANVTKRDFNGKILWIKDFEGTGIEYITLVKDQAQVLVENENYWLNNAEDGKTLSNIKLRWAFYVDGENAFYISSGIKKINLNDPQSEIWHFEISDSVILQPIVTSNTILVRTGQKIGRINAINPDTGLLIWCSDEEIISNLALSAQNQSIYALSANGIIIKYDIANGQTTKLAEVLPNEILLNGEAPQVGVLHWHLMIKTIY